MIGIYLGFRLSHGLATTERSITTALGCDAVHKVPSEDPVLVTILRASMPVYEGVQKVFPMACSGFIGAERDEVTLESKITYVRIPDLKGKQVVVVDTMIATGNDMVAALGVVERYKPERMIVAGAIVARPGMEKLFGCYPELSLYAGVIDPELNEKGYIKPGLGDAGDRSYGRCVKL